MFAISQKPHLHRIPELKPSLFWDTDFTKLDYSKNKQAIITRVFERGSIEEVMDIILYYGDEEVKSSLLNSSYLMENAVALACNLYHLTPKQFKCSSKKQYHATFMKLLNG